jgi:sirohydrochlorin cobaltochelatase
MTLPAPRPRGIVLFAHGSRDPLWRAPIEAVAAQIRTRQPGTPVQCAYLELCTPSLAEAAADMATAGVRHLRVFPLFLGVGKHAREDLPELLESLQVAHPGLEIELLPAVGENPQLIALMADIALAG